MNWGKFLKEWWVMQGVGWVGMVGYAGVGWVM